jgi:parallel beta-helix repeat protein
MAFESGAAHAATLCVNPGGTAGCYASITAAVNAAPSGSTIQVAQGIYKESVVIAKTVLIIGDSGNAIIDATGKGNGIFINGMASAPSAGISGVVISGLTVRNANFEGILVANAVGITISDNTIYGNNLGLVTGSSAACPGLPAFETNEAEDCGEGIHLMGVDHSILSNNDIENNAGGILISDETGPSYENLITGNTVADNAWDCGITIASHSRAPNLPAGPSYAVFHNTISHNRVQHNGSLGQGAGVGIFAPGPGSTATANVVIDNVLSDNGLGGVTMHIHAAPGVAGVPAAAPGVNLSDNVIAGNEISGNSADVDDPNSPGPTGISIVSVAPVTGTVIAQNTFALEVADIVFQAPAGTVEAHLNNFNATAIAVDTEGAGYVDASQNWWACPGGPGTPGCATTMGSNVYVPSWRSTPFATSRPGRP